MEKELDIRVSGTYKLIRKIGEGGYGEVWRAIDVRDRTEVAIKLEHVKIYPSVLNDEVEFYRHLQDIPGIPRIYWHDQDTDYRVLVLELLGPSLEDLFNFCDRRFSIKTVAMLAHQLICRLRSIHDRGVMHRDVKPQNFLMGTGRQGNTVYVTDLGMAWSQENAGVGTKSRGLLGTARFASIKGHTGEEQDARDDLESVGYMLIYFLRGSLPWQGLKAETDEDRTAKILESKMNIDDETLFEGCPAEIGLFFAHIRSLESRQRPDYSHLQSLFLNLMKRHEFEWDNVFDWTEKLFYEQLGNG